MRSKVVNLFAKNVTPNLGENYSELLKRFILHFDEELSFLEYVDEAVEVAILAWNIGNMSRHISPAGIQKTMNSLNYGYEESLVIKRMVDHKNEKFKKYTNFIVDYELKDMNDGGDPMLSVVSQKEEDYISNMLNERDEDHALTEEDFAENYINRYAIILKPKQPFLDWYYNLNLEEDIDEEIKESNIYLINDTIDDLDNWLRKKYDQFFTMELGEWHNIKKKWPQKRNYKMFNLWFHVEISKMIYDLEKEPILKEQ